MPAEGFSSSSLAIANAELAIDHARTGITEQISALHDEIMRSVDWRHWFRRHPVAFIVAAIGLGYAIGRPR